VGTFGRRHAGGIPFGRWTRWAGAPTARRRGARPRFSPCAVDRPRPLRRRSAAPILGRSAAAAAAAGRTAAATAGAGMWGPRARSAAPGGEAWDGTLRPAAAACGAVGRAVRWTQGPVRGGGRGGRGGGEGAQGGPARLQKRRQSWGVPRRAATRARTGASWRLDAACAGRGRAAELFAWKRAAARRGRCLKAAPPPRRVPTLATQPSGGASRGWRLREKRRHGAWWGTAPRGGGATGRAGAPDHVIAPPPPPLGWRALTGPGGPCPARRPARPAAQRRGPPLPPLAPTVGSWPDPRVLWVHVNQEGGGGAL